MNFKDCGYDLNMIGNKRIMHYCNRLQRTYRYKTLFAQMHLAETNTSIEKDYKSMPPSTSLEVMQHKITYLRQEVEFFKVFPDKQKAERLVMNDANLKYQIIHDKPFC